MDQCHEKRTHERFNLFLPCLLSLSREEALSDVIELETLNISAGGVFLKYSRLNGFGASAKMDIIIPPHIIKCPGKSGTHISVGGSIVRTASNGIAVSFCEEYRIAPLDDMLRFLNKKVAWMTRQKNLIAANDQSNLLHIPVRNKTHGHAIWKIKQV